MNLNQIKPILESVNRVALTTHENPDGDGLGCASAMYHYFSDINKDCKIILPSSFPSEYVFLNKGSMFYEYPSNDIDLWLKGVDLVIVFDVGDRKRLNKINFAIDSLNLKTLNIDHHPLIDDSAFTYNFVDTGAAATGVIIYDILTECFSHPLSKDICEGIFTAIMTDTGSFRYSNTNIHCHEIAIECYKVGVNPSYIYQHVYERSSKSRIKLLGTILNNIHFDLNGELAWFVVDNNNMKKCNAVYSDVEGFSDFVRTIDGVEIAFMILEAGENRCRINFRSKGKYTVNDIAKSLGGGGHPFAAGAQMDSSIEQATPFILDVVKSSVHTQNEK